ncbi:MAG TPA: hypothetical protein VKG24_32210 [Pseudolabrys sp.]|nr:hypothetical protein [Pseudolabrys sp.]
MSTGGNHRRASQDENNQTRSDDSQNSFGAVVSHWFSPSNPATRAIAALVVAIATVFSLWYVVKRAFTDDVKDLQLFLTFIVVVVPFVILIYFGLAVINYDSIAALSDWPLVLPLDRPSSPLIAGALAFYIGQTMWLWWDWRKLRIPR